MVAIVFPLNPVVGQASGTFTNGTTTYKWDGVKWSAGTATTVDIASTQTIGGLKTFSGAITAPAFIGNSVTGTDWFHSNRDFVNGTLITTSIDYSVITGDPFVLQIRGNKYSALDCPMDIEIQGYIYNSTIINYTGYSIGPAFGITAMLIGSNLCFWFPRQGYWQGYNVHAYTAYGPKAINKVTSITDVIIPNGVKQVVITPKQVLRSDNFNSYSPTLAGIGASGSWNITAANATNADGLAVATGRNNAANQIARTDANGYLQTGWINTTSGDSGITNRLNRIYASHDDYVRYLSLFDFKVSMGLSGKNNYSRRIDYSADANYQVGSMGQAGMGLNEVFHGGSGFIDTWAGTNLPPTTGHVHGFNALHYTSNSLGTTGGAAYGIQVVGQYSQEGQLFSRGCTDGVFSAWRTQIDSVNIASQSVANAAGSTSSFTAVGNVSSGNGNGVMATDGNVYSSWIGDWASNWAARVNRWHDSYYLGTDGTAYHTAVYDTDNTGYYCNPTSWSQFSRLNCNDIFYGDGGWSYFTGVYDTNDTGYYLDPNGTSHLSTLHCGGNIVINNGSPTIYFQDTDQLSSMIHNNSNLLHVLRGAANSTTWAAVGGWWPLTIGLDDNAVRCGGTIVARSTITASASDGRLKENIKEIPNAIEKLKKIRGVTFDWNDLSESLGFVPPQRYNDIGVIAQEIEEVLPQVVALAPFDRWMPEPETKYSDEFLAEKMDTSASGEDYKTVQYERITPLLIQGIKEQQVMIEDQALEISKLQLELIKQKQMTDSLESLFNNLNDRINKLEA